MIKSKQKLKKKNSLLEIFRNHIGYENGININDLFEKYYGEKINNIPKMEAFFKVAMLQQNLNYLRRRTYAFVVLKDNLYFVVTNRSEAQEYLKRLETHRKSIIYMEERLDKAIDEKFYLKFEKGETYEKNN